MLVLTRKIGETVKIGDNIEVTILSIKNDQVKIGINAPKEVDILRKELIIQISDENVQASTTHHNLLSILEKKV
ncbi:carbon storage regulator CsrA [Bacillus coreaensis]